MAITSQKPGLAGSFIKLGSAGSFIPHPFVLYFKATCAKKTESGNCQRSRLFFGILSLEKAFEPGFWSEITITDLLKAKMAAH